MDAATRRNLEITETLRGEPAPTLLSLLDTCATNMGSRLLRHWLHHPLRDRRCSRRQAGGDRGAGRHSRRRSLATLQQTLGRVADVERITARIALRSARPRDLSGLRDTLRVLPDLCAHLAGIEAAAAACSWRRTLQPRPRPARPAHRAR